MKIVIELSDETYDKVINPNNWYNPNSALTDIVKAIENGTPLSKADKIEHVLNGWNDTNYDKCINEIYNIMSECEEDDD